MAKRNEVKFAAQVNKALSAVGVAVRDCVSVQLDVADSQATLKALTAGLKAKAQAAVDVSQAAGVKFGTVIKDGKPAMDDKCPVRMAWWAAIDDASSGLLGDSAYIRKVKTAVNNVMAGLASDISDYNDKAAKRGAYAPKTIEPAGAKPATTVAAPSEPNAAVDPVAQTWNYMRTAPTHLAMMRSVIAKTETGMALEAAIVDALNDYAKQLKKAMGK